MQSEQPIVLCLLNLIITDRPLMSIGDKEQYIVYYAITLSIYVIKQDPQFFFCVQGLRRIVLHYNNMFPSGVT